MSAELRQILDSRTRIPKALSVLRVATVLRSTEIYPLGSDWTNPMQMRKVPEWNQRRFSLLGLAGRALDRNPAQRMGPSRGGLRSIHVCFPMDCRGSRNLGGPGERRWDPLSFASGHTSSNTPGPIRTRTLSGERPGQYWGGGPPGKPFGCCWLLFCAVCVFKLSICADRQPGGKRLWG